jgi:UPF0755 protein
VKRAVIIISLLLISITGVCTMWLWHDMQNQLNSPLNLDTQTDFIIKPGTGLKTIANDLKTMGLMNQPYYLLFEARRQGKEGRIKAGEYEIIPGTTPLQLLDQFVAGKVKQHTLTLIEGWSFTQVIEAIRNHPVLEQTPDLTDGETVMTTLQKPEVSPEGQFFPDTYHFPKGTSDIQFLQRAYDKMQHVLAEEWEQRSDNLPYQSPYEALIMASLIEKETGLPEERGDIAGVFVRRTQKGMRLQTDPTVIYAMGDQYDGRLLRKDLTIDSPYNTYVYAGLPPTPIALTSRESLHAALHPKEGKTLYFVSRGDGSHHFSETLEEHNRAVAKYILGKQKNEKE